ncbi:MAG: hypothetical protein JWO86_8011 [Myxococcaceae bacterium]|nr:hypothetical protein [Myxococcaceae bacterium]
MRVNGDATHEDVEVRCDDTHWDLVFGALSIGLLCERDGKTALTPLARPMMQASARRPGTNPRSRGRDHAPPRSPTRPACARSHLNGEQQHEARAAAVAAFGADFGAVVVHDVLHDGEA